MNRDKHRKTMDLANSLLKRYPDSKGFNFPRGVAYLGLGKVADAKAIAKQFLKDNDQSVNGNRLMGRVYLAKGLGDSAVYHLKRAESKDSNGFYSYLLGKAYNLTGDYRKAVQAFDSSIRKESGTAYSAIRERAIARVGMNDTASARMDFEEAISLAPKDPVNYNARGYHLWAHSNQHEKAIKDYSAAIRLNKNYGFAFNNRAWSYYVIGKKQLASTDLKHSERRRPNNPFLHWNRGKIALAEKGPEACGHFRKAIELGFAHYRPKEAQDVMSTNCTPKRKENVENAPTIHPTKPRKSNAPGG